MVLTLYETPDQKVQRERKKFGISVEQEVQRFTRAKGALAVRQLQDKEDEEEERRQALGFQRQKFRELIAPTMDAEIQRVNDTQDERTKFRDLIMPSVEQEVDRFSRARESMKFRSLIQPSLDALRTPTATATPSIPGGVVADRNQKTGVVINRFGGTSREGTGEITQGVLDDLGAGFLDAFSVEEFETSPSIEPLIQKFKFGSVDATTTATPTIDRGGNGFSFGRLASAISAPNEPLAAAVNTLGQGIVGAPPSGGLRDVQARPAFDVTSPEADQLLQQAQDVVAGVAGTAFTSVLPPEFWEEVEKVPVAGTTLSRQGQFWTSAGGVAILIGSIGMQGVGQTVAELAGESGASLLGSILEREVGAPSGTVPVLEALGGVGAGIAAARGVRTAARGLIPDDDIPAARRALDELNATSQIDVAPDTAVRARAAGEGVSEADNVAADLAGLESDKLLRRINQVLVEQEASSKEIIKARGPEFGARAASYKEVYKREIAKGVPPQDAAATASRQRAGRYEGLRGIPEGEFSEPDKLSMWNMVDENAKLQDGEIARSHDALTKLHTGQGLQPNEIKLLGRTYGPEFEKNLNSALKTNPLTGLKELAYELSIVPKAFLSAGDISFLGRQGAFFALTHPIEWAKSWIPSIRAAVSEKFSQQFYDEAFERLSGKYGAGVADTLLRSPDAPPAAIGEVRFGRNLAEKINPRSIPGIGNIKGLRAIPGIGDIIRGSNRAFTAAGNSLRANTFETIVNGWESGSAFRRLLGLKPIEVTRGRLDTLANQMNRATARGTLGTGNLAQFFQATTWAPQMTVAPVQYIGYLFNPDAIIRQQAWRDFAVFLSAGVSMLGLAKVSGYEVGDDPLSSAFGKVVFGETRVNIWGPWQVQARFAGQFATGLKSSARGGPAYSKDRLSTGLEFFRSRLAPQYGLVVDVLDEETFIGEETTVKGSIQNLTIPLAYQDALDAFKEYGLLGGAAVGAVAITGVGVQTYGGDVDNQMREMPKWKDVPLEDESDLRDFIREVGQQYSQARRDHPDAEFTQADVALDMGRATNREQLGNWAAGAITNKLPLNEERMTFALDNQDALDDRTLAFALPVAIARKYLTDENFDRYNKVEK